MGFLQHVVLFSALLVGISAGQNCPISGPAYPAADDTTSPTLTATKPEFLNTLTQALSGGGIDGGATSFSIQVFSPHSDTAVFEYHHTATNANRSSPVGPQTLYRIGSVSKLVSAYTILSKFSHRRWDDPIVDYIPELAKAKFKNDVDTVDWEDVTLGMLASHQSGIGSDCM